MGIRNIEALTGEPKSVSKTPQLDKRGGSKVTSSKNSSKGKSKK